MFQIIYLFEISNQKNRKTYSFIILFENISVDILCLLSFYEQKYSFIKLKKNESKQLNNDLEYGFKFNKLNIKKLNELLLVGVDTHLESTHFSLQLKQKNTDNGFNVHNLGSIKSNNIKSNNIKNKVSSVGSSLKVFLSIVEGIHSICQNLKNKNSLVVINSEFFKRKNNNNLNLILFFKTLQQFCNISVLNSSIYETGIYSINNYLCLNKINFLNFSSIYLINVINIENKILNKLLHISFNSLNQTKLSSLKTVYLNQSYKNNVYSKNFFYLPTKSFFENEEIFYNNKGILKYTVEILQNKNSKSNWKLIRTLFNNLKKKSSFVNSHFSINFSDSQNKKNLLTSIYFIFLATNSLKINNFLLEKNALFFTKKLVLKKKIKLTNTKIQYWLNDFFIDGKDSYSSDSLIMTKCSKVTRLQTTNFF